MKDMANCIRIFWGHVRERWKWKTLL